jgi:hypothetical protein
LAHGVPPSCGANSDAIDCPPDTEPGRVLAGLPEGWAGELPEPDGAAGGDPDV